MARRKRTLIEILDTHEKDIARLKVTLGRGSAGGGGTDHGGLTGNADDDHTQYHNDARAATWLGTQGLSVIGDVTITSIASGELVQWNGSAFVNQTFAEMGIEATGHTHISDDVTDLHSRYTDGEAVSAVGTPWVALIAAEEHHTKYLDSEAIAAVEATARTFASTVTVNEDFAVNVPVGVDFHVTDAGALDEFGLGTASGKHIKSHISQGSYQQAMVVSDVGSSVLTDTIFGIAYSINTGATWYPRFTLTQGADWTFYGEAGARVFGYDHSADYILASKALDMGGSKVQNIATPTATTDATTKAYVDLINDHSRYLDSEAVAAVGTPWVGLIAAEDHHTKYTDGEVDAIVLTHKNLSSAHHTRYADSEAAAKIAADALYSLTGHNHSGTYLGISATAAAATKLATARTIDITGDITAPAQAFDGTTNIAIVATVTNDSHTHGDSTIDGLNASAVTAGLFAIARIPTGTSSSTVSLGNHNHSGVYATAGHTILSHDTTATGADLTGVTDGGNADAYHTHSGGGATNMADLGDVTVTSIAANELIFYTGSGYVNRTLAEAGIAAASHNHSGADITSGTVPFANLPTGTGSSQVAIGNHSHGGGALGDLSDVTMTSEATGEILYLSAGTWINRTFAEAGIVPSSGGTFSRTGSAVIMTDGVTIGGIGANLSNGALIVGSTTVGIGFDKNEITQHGDHFHIQASGGNLRLGAEHPTISGQQLQVAELSISTTGGKIAIDGYGTTEGGQLDFLGGSSYATELYLDRYGNDLRFVYNATVEATFNTVGITLPLGSNYRLLTSTHSWDIDTDGDDFRVVDNEAGQVRWRSRDNDNGYLMEILNITGGVEYTLSSTNLNIGGNYITNIGYIDMGSGGGAGTGVRWDSDTELYSTGDGNLQFRLNGQVQMQLATSYTRIYDAVRLSDGSAGSPAYTYASETGLGWYRASAAVNGVAGHVKLNTAMSIFSSGGYATARREDSTGQLKEQSSHPRFKKNIRDISGARSRAKSLARDVRAKVYEEEGSDTGWEQGGLLSTEVEQHWPEAIRYNPTPGMEDDPQGIHYEMLTIPLLELAAEHDEELDRHKARLDTHTQRIKALEDQVAALLAAL